MWKNKVQLYHSRIAFDIGRSYLIDSYTGHITAKKTITVMLNSKVITSTVILILTEYFFNVVLL